MRVNIAHIQAPNKDFRTVMTPFKEIAISHV